MKLFFVISCLISSILLAQCTKLKLAWLIESEKQVVDKWNYWKSNLTNQSILKHQEIDSFVKNEVKRIANFGYTIKPDLSPLDNFDAKVILITYKKDLINNEFLQGTFQCYDNFWGSLYKDFYNLNETCNMINEYGDKFDTSLFSYYSSSVAQSSVGDRNIFLLKVFAKPILKDEFRHSDRPPIVLEEDYKNSTVDRVPLKPSLSLDEVKKMLLAPLKMNYQFFDDLKEIVEDEVKHVAEEDNLNIDLNLFKQWQVLVSVGKVESIISQDELGGNLKCFSNVLEMDDELYKISEGCPVDREDWNKFDRYSLALEKSKNGYIYFIRVLGKKEELESDVTTSVSSITTEKDLGSDSSDDDSVTITEVTTDDPTKYDYTPTTIENTAPEVTSDDSDDAVDNYDDDDSTTTSTKTTQKKIKNKTPKTVKITTPQTTVHQ